MKLLVTILFIAVLALSYGLIKQKRHNAFLLREKISRDSATTDRFMKYKNVKETEFLSIPLDTNDIIFLGSSITEPFPLTYLANNIHIKNFATAGSTIADVDYMIKHIASKHPKKIFIETGINDVRYSYNDKAMEQNFKDQLDTIFYRLRTYTPQTKVYIYSILPISTADYPPDTDTINAIIRKLNSFITLTASKVGIVYLNTYDLFQVNGVLPANLSTDGIHVTKKVYDKWYSYLQPYLN